MGATEASALSQGPSDIVPERRPVVVVGIDGSDSSSKALAWAAQEARMRGAVLRVVHAWHLPGLSDAAYLQARSQNEPSGLSPSDEKVYDGFRAEAISLSAGEPGEAEASVASQIAAVLGRPGRPPGA